MVLINYWDVRANLYSDGENLGPDYAAGWSAWDVVAAAEYALATFVLFITWVICAAGVKRNGDRTRLGFLWLKWAMPFFMLWIAAMITIDTVNSVSASLNDGRHNWVLCNRIYPIAWLFSNVADIFLFGCVLYLSLNTLSKCTGEEGTNRILSWVGKATAALLTVLTVSGFALMMAEFANPDARSSYTINFQSVIDVYSTFNIVYFVCVVVLLIINVRIFKKSIRQKKDVSISSRLFAVALLNFARNLYVLIETIKDQIGERDAPDYLEVVDPVCYSWLTVVLMCLLTNVGMRTNPPRVPPANFYTGLPYNMQMQQPQQGYWSNAVANGAMGPTAGSGPWSGKPELAATVTAQQRQLAVPQNTVPANTISQYSAYRGMQSQQPLQSPVPLTLAVASPVVEAEAQTAAHEVSGGDDLVSPQSPGLPRAGWNNWPTAYQAVSPVWPEPVYEMNGREQER